MQQQNRTSKTYIYLIGVTDANYLIVVSKILATVVLKGILDSVMQNLF
jgi:hypothetical protein